MTRKAMQYGVLCSLLALTISIPAHAQVPPAALSAQVADAAMARWPQGNVNGSAGAKWQYEEGTLLGGITGLWYSTANPKYYRYVQQSVDQLVPKDGSIPTYAAKDMSLDNLLMGRQALMLYGVTLDKRYYTAAKLLRQQLDNQPRTKSGGFWHKERYPSQMWLDGLYMAEPFYAEYAMVFQQSKDFDDIAVQFIVSEKHLRDPKTGLLYHGWDEAHEQKWANKQTGTSPEFWSRAMGWYAMALVDVLDYFPKDHPQRPALIAILNRLAAAVAAQQDEKSGLWFNVINKPSAKGNYLESSASSMFVYALEKGVRMGYLPTRYEAVGTRGYTGLVSHFVQNTNGEVHISGMIRSAGLGGDPYRAGDLAYYGSEPVVSDDPKGIGAFLMASSEAEMSATALKGRGKTVLVDAWYNSQMRANAAGQQESFHYKWEDNANSGFSFLGRAFRAYGIKTETLYGPPTLAALKNAQIYIVASPDIPSKNPTPHYLAPQDIPEVLAWVRQGGVLVMMENDGNNSEFEHMNQLMEKFGVHFNAVDNNMVPGSDYDKGKLLIPAGNPIFTPKKIYMKEISSITPTTPAKSIMEWQGNTVMAVAKLGKGTVYAVVDPWLYNEYTDGRKLPMDFENFGAAKELVPWLLRQVPEAQTTKSEAR